MSENNPLKQYFRKPGIWIKLPSQGQYYDTKPSDFNDMGEIAVYPMTAKDELLMKNADALLNGTAITQLLNSCVPSITSVDTMPAIDLDAVLLAIRRCTYGEDLDIETLCPSCNAKNESVLNLNHFISSITTVDKIEPIVLEDGIKVFIKPVNVKQLLNLNWVQYEQVRNIQLAEQGNMDEKEKVNILQKSYNTLTNQNLLIISACIDTVLLPDGVTVTDSANIKEWVEQISRPEFKKIENGIMSLAQKGMKKNFNVNCQGCSTDYESNIDLNPTTFFA
jgi:hypothetical protein